MTSAQTLIATVVLAACSTWTATAQAQFVKGNEAVKVLPDGTRKVETPPTAGALLAPPCPASRLTCSPSGWRMLETQDGLQECTEPYGRPTTCRASSFGREKHSRLWIVKTRGQWMQCQFPDLESKCVKLGELPHPAVQ